MAGARRNEKCLDAIYWSKADSGVQWSDGRAVLHDRHYAMEFCASWRRAVG